MKYFETIGKKLGPLGEIVKEGESRGFERTDGVSKYIDTYVYNFVRIRRTRETSHYSPHLISKILYRHHRNASVFFVILVILLITLGIFRGSEVFNIPAAASIYILVSIYILFTAVIYSWFRTWFLTALILILISVNILWKLDLDRTFSKAERIAGPTRLISEGRLPISRPTTGFPATRP